MNLDWLNQRQDAAAAADGASTQNKEKKRIQHNGARERGLSRFEGIKKGDMPGIWMWWRMRRRRRRRGYRRSGEGSDRKVRVFRKVR